MHTPAYSTAQLVCPPHCMAHRLSKLDSSTREPHIARVDESSMSYMHVLLAEYTVHTAQLQGGYTLLPYGVYICVDIITCTIVVITRRKLSDAALLVPVKRVLDVFDLVYFAVYDLSSDSVLLMTCFLFREVEIAFQRSFNYLASFI